MKSFRLGREIIETIVVALLIFIVVRFAVQTFRVDGISMQPGLHNDEYVMVDKLAYIFHQPSRGDVIVFHYPLDTTQDFIKRVIGLPGDTIRYNNTSIWVDGVLLKEPYISSAENDNSDSLKVPPNEYFVMGDNRPESDDSRSWGFVPNYDLIGKAVVVYWPVPNWELIPTYTTVYANIK